MQHLEVSGAIRPLYGSLGVKGLTFILDGFEYSRQLFEKKNSYTQFHENPSSKNQVVPRGKMDRQTDRYVKDNSRF